MSEQTQPSSPLSDWPVFEVRHSFNPNDIAPDVEFEPTEVVLFPATNNAEGQWISAKFGSYVPITEIN